MYTFDYKFNTKLQQNINLTRCVCETQNAPDNDQVHKDKYLDTSTKILSQEMLNRNMKFLIFIFLSDV